MARIMPHLLLLIFFWVGYLFIFLGTTGAAPEMQAAEPAVAAGASSIAVPQKQAEITPPPFRFILTAPDIKDATSVRMNNPAIVKWLASAKAVAGSKQQRLTVQGQVLGTPLGARVRGGVEMGTLNFQFTSPLDTKGMFGGDIYVDNPNQPVPLVFQLLDASNSPLALIELY